MNRLILIIGTLFITVWYIVSLPVLIVMYLLGAYRPFRSILYAIETMCQPEEAENVDVKRAIESQYLKRKNHFEQ